MCLRLYGVQGLSCADRDIIGIRQAVYQMCDWQGEMNALPRLEEIGLRKVGARRPGPDGPVMTIEPEVSKSNDLYAFVCDGRSCT